LPVPLKRIRIALFSRTNPSSKSANGFSSTRAQFWSMAARWAGYDTRKLAKILQVDVRQVQRYIREDLGRSPREWLGEQRIIAARRILLETGSTKHVAHELGFKQVGHFCRQFKQYYGVPPSEYLSLQMRRNWENVALR
jgi:AraC-like DNA-binding protein